MLWFNMIEQFEQAITRYKLHSSPIMTLGERGVLKNWHHLSKGAKQLYIFLFHRKPNQFRREHIRYVDVNKPHYFNSIDEEELALRELELNGFVVQCQNILRTDVFLVAQYYGFRKRILCVPSWCGNGIPI